MLLLSLLSLACNRAAAPPPVTEAPAAPAAPTLDLTLTGGEISLVQLKNGSTDIPATIHGSTGSVHIGPNSSGELSIPVRAWFSDLELRDARVRETFFHATDYPSATFNITQIDGLNPELPLGESAEGRLQGTLVLYSGEVPVQARVKLTQTKPGSYTLETTQNFQVSIEALGLGENLSALLVECGHESVGDAVKVGVNLQLSTN